MRNITSDLLQTQTASRLLSVENLTVLILLLLLQLSHLAILLPLQFLPLLVHSCIAQPLALLNFFGHLLLLQLAIKNALVRILHFSLVQALLFDLLLALDSPHFFPLVILLADSFFFLLLLDREIVHVFLINVRLLTQSCTLRRLKSLLVRLPWVVIQLRHRIKIHARLLIV